jgi:DNA-binding XRE family transcriptional regulator
LAVPTRRLGLTQARSEKFRTIAEFARALGVNKTTAWAWEKKGFHPNLAQALRIARLLGHSVEELFGDEPSERDVV